MMVCPGFTDAGIENTALGGQGRPTRLPRSSTVKLFSAESVADAVYAGIRQRKRLLVLTPIGKVAYWISRFFPAFYEK